MSNFFKNFILDEEQQEETFDYIDISFPFSDEFHRLLTCDQYDDIEAYYLFNKVKIWQKKINKDDKRSLKEKIIMFLLSVLLVVSIPLGLLYEIHSNELERDRASYSKQAPKQWNELSLKTKIRLVLRAIVEY